MSSSQHTPHDHDRHDHDRHDHDHAFNSNGRLTDVTDISDAAEIIGVADIADIAGITEIIEANQHNELYEHSEWPVFICILGSFRLFKGGLPVAIHGAKTEALLTSLALQPDHCLPRDVLLNGLWPNCNEQDVSHSFTNLVSKLNNRLRDEMNGAAPILHMEGAYRLNVAGGIGIDLTCFEQQADDGDLEYRRGDYAAAVSYYRRAANLYKGDPYLPVIPPAIMDAHTMLRCTQVKDRCLTVLGRLAECYFALNDYDACIQTSFRLLNNDPFREDAHRMVMKCYVRLGQRSQAVSQYRLCEKILQGQREMKPEANTADLYEQVRLDPESV